jgi:3' terminal RNA ribose 2'-O-methyltransferase Hen1
MLLTITAGISSDDFGYLLHKNPTRSQVLELPFGNAHVFYPKLGSDEAQVALLVDVDPVGLVRRRSPQAENTALAQYVNDRPYAASSLLSVALVRVFSSAMRGVSKERQQLAETALPFRAHLPAVPCRDGEAFLRRLFEPLGYRVNTQRSLLDERFPEWGESPYVALDLEARVRLADLLTQLYVLIPVLDADKHYWVGEDEVEKLLRRGEGWLNDHPQRDIITRRYLKHDRRLTQAALARLTEGEDPDEESTGELRAAEEEAIEKPLLLAQQRIDAVMSALRSRSAKSVLDLGCGEGRLLQALLQDPTFERIAGMDVSWRILESARRRLQPDRLPSAQRQRIELIHGSLLYRDKRLSGWDAATVVEVIEHLDPPRLAAFERVLFEFAQPMVVILTTPNVEYNALFPGLAAGRFRHKDHRFEWTRAQFQTWSQAIAARHGYSVQFRSVGPEDAVHGSPTQMGVFTR